MLRLRSKRRAGTNGQLPTFVTDAIRRCADDAIAYRRAQSRWRRRLAARPDVPVVLREHLSGSQTLEVGEHETHFEVAPAPAELLAETERLLDRS